jgi:redox-sensitive bicupin YhaK (pirin superfamily)
MIDLRLSQDRGFADHGWLKSRHTFSFADYYDAGHMGFRSLRVINEDRIAGGQGFGTHPHRDMEIISYVITGGLKHKDSMGNETVILPGEVQRMSAGSGIEHSEYNNMPDLETHFFQIWIKPSEKGGAPGYGQKSFETELNFKNLVLVASPNGREGSITIKQDADMYIGRLKQNESLEFKIKKGRALWIQVVSGAFTIGGHSLGAGDAASTVDESGVEILATKPGEIILFDLA